MREGVDRRKSGDGGGAVSDSVPVVVTRVSLGEGTLRAWIHEYAGRSNKDEEQGGR